MTSLLIILPRGLGVSGVTTWGLRLAGGLAARGRRVGILTMGDEAARELIPPGVAAFVHEGMPIDGLRGDLSALAPAYREAIDALAGDGPVVVSPNLHGDCYGAAVEASRGRDDVRIVGWQHSDIAYDTHVLRWYGSALAHVVAVSGRIEERLRAGGAGGGTAGWLEAPWRAPISLIPYGIEVRDALAVRPPGTVGVPLRLLYTGRLDHQQKRAGALAPMMRELAAMGTPALLTVAGDGPALADLEAAGRGDIDLLGAVSPSRVATLLDEADCFVLPSRYEGLSVAMLEAMARGCVPVVARVDSGLDDAASDGVSAVIADVGPEAGAEEAGAAMARGVRRAVEIGLAKLAAGAHGAAGRFSLERHLDRVEVMLEEVAASRAGVWPADRPAAFSTWDDRYGSGSVPPDGPARLARALDTLGGVGARVAIHGTGEHTRQLAHVIEARLGSVVCFCDDNPGAWGETVLGRPVVAPAEAGRAGATHVVISSWLHEGEVWQRRGVYEGQGVEVARLYG